MLLVSEYVVENRKPFFRILAVETEKQAIILRVGPIKTDELQWVDVHAPAHIYLSALLLLNIM